MLTSGIRSTQTSDMSHFSTRDPYDPWGKSFQHLFKGIARNGRHRSWFRQVPAIQCIPMACLSRPYSQKHREVQCRSLARLSRQGYVCCPNLNLNGLAKVQRPIILPECHARLQQHERERAQGAFEQLHGSKTEPKRPEELEGRGHAGKPVQDAMNLPEDRSCLMTRKTQRQDKAHTQNGVNCKVYPKYPQSKFVRTQNMTRPQTSLNALNSSEGIKRLQP